jgi:hypothetical protein
LQRDREIRRHDRERDAAIRHKQAARQGAEE